MKKTLSAAFIVAALSVTSACGGDDGGDRPSKSELTDQIVKSSDGALTKKQADCAAEAILDSDLSDEAIKAVAEGDNDFEPSKDDEKAQGDATTAITKCLTP